MCEENKQGHATASSQSIIAIIPARGGSKGIPRKNILPIAGKPLIAWSIEAARTSRYVERVVVSTDDGEIASISEEHGAQIVWRPPGISGDTSSSESALLHTLDRLKHDEGHEPELVLFLQATSPLRRSDDIDSAIETFNEQHADSLFSGCYADRFTWTLTRNSPEPNNYDPAHRPRRQEVGRKTVEENGSIYLFKPWVIRKYASRLGGAIAVYVMPRLYSFEVDEREDLELMERIMQAR
jgi:N-acylneuraminate cytidylyltransferase